MKLDYPIVITKDKKNYLVYIPDLDINTFGETFDEAIDMAYDAIRMVYISREDKKLKINKPTKIENILKNNKYKNDIVTHISIDPIAFRQQNDNKSIRRNITLPNWLDKIVRENKINVSEFLQNALMNELKIKKIRA